jgi:hypothetical protein
MLCGEATDTNFIVFGFAWSRINNHDLPLNPTGAWNAYIVNEVLNKDVRIKK